MVKGEAESDVKATTKLRKSDDSKKLSDEEEEVDEVMIDLQTEGEVEELEVPVKKKILDPYKANLSHEESEVKRRDVAEDQDLFVAVCEQIQCLMGDIRDLKKEKDTQELVEEKRTEVLMLMLTVRRLSRVQKIRVRDSRDLTGDSRQNVDGVTLHLQNLLYEVAHLKKEIRRCLDFHSADRDIDLVELKQFYSEAPESISRVTETVDDPHQQHLARLDWELEQRRNQTNLFEKLTKEKNAIAAIIADQERKLNSLAPRINTILEATSPLQEALGLTLDIKHEQQKTAQLLPMPLYTLWIQVNAFSEACDPLIKAEIMGDLEAAKKLVTPDEDSQTDQSDSDNDQEQQEDSSASRKLRHGAKKEVKKAVDEKEDLKKKTFELHPLQVCITIDTKEGNKIMITFMYALTLRFVTTKCTVHILNKPKFQLADVLSGDHLLGCLLSDDEGRLSPNPASIYYLQRAKLVLLDHLVGRPYRWAQTLCGLSFPYAGKVMAAYPGDEDSKDSPSDTTMTLPPKQSESISSELSAEHMCSVIHAVRHRLKARLSLNTQLHNLQSVSTTSTINIPQELLTQQFPNKIITELKSWRPITWPDYSAFPATNLLRESGVVTKQHMLFKAMFERKHVRLDALVAISLDHPRIIPVISLNLQWQGQHHASNNPHVRQMESEVNVHWEELVQNKKDRLYILPLMLYRIAMCLDIYTEAYSTYVESNNSDGLFNKEKIFFRPSRGPERAYPFKYLPKLGVFAQR